MATFKKNKGPKDPAKKPFKSAVTHITRVKLSIVKAVAATVDYNDHFKSVIDGLTLAKKNAKAASQEDLFKALDQFLRDAQALKKAKITKETSAKIEELETKLKDFFTNWPHPGKLKAEKHATKTK